MALREKRQLTLVESRDSIVSLSDDEAAHLESLGRQLAGSSEWWGAGAQEEPARSPSVTSCIALGDGKWRIRVSDAVGLIGLPSVQISIQPKIPVQHLLYLMEASDEFPRLSPDRALAMNDLYFWELVMHWFVDELESVLRRGLLRDYEERRSRLETIRGSADVLETARLYYAGQLAFDCVYDEFDFNTPPNRLLLAAARRVAGTPVRNSLLRRRASRAIARFDRVGQLRSSDVRWRADRRAVYYTDATTLARHLILGVGRTISHGEGIATSFLIRTPEMVEKGLKALLSRALPHRRIEKRGLQLEGSTMTLNPDLLFDSGDAVGDVKYKILSGEWPRPDLYQLVAFATGFRSSEGILVHFASSDEYQLPSVRVGDVQLHAASWGANKEISPEEALGALAVSIDDLLT